MSRQGAKPKTRKEPCNPTVGQHAQRSRRHISYPWICKYYNSAVKCRYGEDGLGCTAMHICLHFVKGDCRFKRRCRRNHDIYNKQCRTLLERAGVDARQSIELTLAEIRQILQDTDASTSDKQAVLINADTVCHSGIMRALSVDNLSRALSVCSLSGLSNEDDPPEICMYNLRKAGCWYKKQCHYLHCNKQFQWQFAKQGRDTWEKFSDQENMRIESEYTDPNNSNMTVDLLSLGSVFIDFDKMHIELMIGEYKVRRLSTRSWVRVPETQQNLATKWAWYWKNEFNQWVEYGKGNHKTDLNSTVLEREYLENPNGTFEFKTTKNSYTVFFKGMFQKNKKFGTERPIKRRPLPYSEQRSGNPGNNPASLNIPEYWDKLCKDDNSFFSLIKIQPSGQTAQEFKKVQDRFEDTMSPTAFRIVSIERIQNLELWEGYQWKLNWLKKKTDKSREAFEKLLFHGTKEEYIDAICKQGFDWRLSGTTAGTLYGQGSYFAQDANYSSNYATGNKMFLVRVLVGDYIRGHKGYKVPPNKPTDSTERYHSCVDNEQNPSIFVVFEHVQSYPEYLITYCRC